MKSLFVYFLRLLSIPQLYYRKLTVIFLTLLSSFSVIFSQGKVAISSEVSKPTISVLNHPEFFPLGVWLQAPSNAARYKGLGINLYVGLWQGPTTAQLETLRNKEMPVICQQNEIALSNSYKNTVIGWLQQDEPDNAQKRSWGIIYNAPIPPFSIQDSFSKIKRKDSTRPILLNLGQGVAWDNWKGRGTRTNHPEDYKEYVKGGDIISYDIYPATHKHPEVKGRLEFVAYGVNRLKSLTAPSQKVWNIIGVGRINETGIKPTPEQVRSQVWMSIIHGSTGIIYFVHQFNPRFTEAAIFEDPEMMTTVEQLNKLITNLATVLNSPNTKDVKQLQLAHPDAPIAFITKREGDSLYLLTVSMKNKENTGSFKLNPVVPNQEADVLGENRKIQVKNNMLEDHYKPYEPHIYKIDM